MNTIILKTTINTINRITTIKTINIMTAIKTIKTVAKTRIIDTNLFLLCYLIMLPSNMSVILQMLRKEQPGGEDGGAREE